MRVLIGCEESGVVRRAFRQRGHEAWSCDILPARDGETCFHIRGDIKEVLKSSGEWDLIILHPSCRTLTIAGNSTYGEGMPKHHERLLEIDWTVDLWCLALTYGKRVALENPISVIWQYLGAPYQYVQPYHFGHPEQKKTGFARHNLPPLRATADVKRIASLLPNLLRERSHFMPPSSTRSRDRSESFLGIANALADQWGRT